MKKLTNIIDKLGDSNPQVFRELKERLTPRNITLALMCAAIVQGFILLYFNGQIPVSADEGLSAQQLGIHSNYCVTPAGGGYEEGYCRFGANGGFDIDWQKWWLDIFSCLAWILPFGLILGLVYTLVADLVREEKRGTLNFIRLSPQSAQTIFSGKIIGVPSLIYLTIAAILPLHFIAGMNAGANIILILSWDLAVGTLAFFCASATVLYVLLGGSQAILTTIAIGYLLWTPLMAINMFVTYAIERNGAGFGLDSLRWFGLPITSSALWFYSFGIGTCLVATYWIWQALDRRYLAPTDTIIGKSQSYRLNLCWQVWIAGFAVSAILSGSREYDYDRSSAANWFAAIDFAALFLLIPTLLPSKQALQDWSRYRRERVTDRQRKFWQRELFKDLISNDKSPALLAVAINLGMALVLWLPLSMFAFARLLTDVQFAVSICIAASLIAIYAAIAHLALFFNFKQRKTWIIGSIGSAMSLPILGAFVLSASHTPTGLAAVLLVFSPLASIGIPQLPIGALVASILAQLGIFSFLTRQLQRKLQQSGQSQTNRLAADRAV